MENITFSREDDDTQQSQQQQQQQQQQPQQQLSVDDILEKAGPFKLWQIIILLSMAYLSIFLFYNCMLSVFTGYNPPWTCTTNSTSEFCTHNRNASLATDDSRYQQRCHLNRSEWSYVTTQTRSYVTEFDLVCNKTYLAAVIGSAYFIGGVIGCFISGTLTDRFGRKPTLCMTSLITTFSSIGTSFVSREWQLILISVLGGSGLYAAIVSSVLYLTEMVPPKFRHLYPNTMQVSYSFSLLYVDILASYVQDWRQLSLYAALPSVPLIILLLLVPESPRWLFLNGRAAEAKCIMTKISRIDCGEIITADLSTSSSHNDYTLIDLFRNRTVLKLTLSICSLWFIAALVYFLCAMETSNIGGDMYQAFALSVIPDLVSCFTSAILCNRIGRRKLVSISFFLTGTSLAVLILVMKFVSSIYFINISLLILSRYAINTVFVVLFVWTPELFPTVLRSRGFFICAICDRVGVATVPFIIKLLQNINHLLPFIIGCGVAVIGGIIGLLLPETAGKPTRETYKDFFENPSTVATNRVAKR